MPEYTIQKARPPKKKETKQEEEIKKAIDPMFAIFGNYQKSLENKIL